MFVTAIIAAGGRGLRFGGDRPKQLVEFGGRSALERSVAAFAAHPDVAEVIVALPEELVAAPPPYLAAPSRVPVRVVAGGARRQDSVARAFAAADPRCDLVVVHDAARPFASAALIARTIAAAAESGAALAALASRDTVKQGVEEGGAWRVAATLPRETIFLAQTPQAFRREVLRDALAVEADATDEAALAERAGHRVRLVDGEMTNIKITTAADLAHAGALASGAPVPDIRVGTGYDLHRLVEGDAIWLGGVRIPFDRGMLAHSDGDPVCHAITDAILGAAAAGDIGRMFPDTDPQWRGASSITMLEGAVAVVRARGFEIVNVDAVIVAERPKVLPHVDAMRAALAAALGIALDRVSVKGKTNERVDAVGRGEAIAVHATALLRRA